MVLPIRPDPPALRTQKPIGELLAQIHEAKGAPTIPETFSLAAWIGDVIDQGADGDCSACSTSGALKLVDNMAAAAGQVPPVGFQVSQRRLYAATREIIRASALSPGTTGIPLPSLTDAGASLGVVMQALSEIGVYPMSPALSPDGRYCDAWTEADVAGIVLAAGQPASNLDDDLTLGELETAGEKLLVGEYRLDTTTSDAMTQVKEALSVARAPLIISFPCGAELQNWNPGSAPLGATDKATGGHAVFICGYVGAPDGSTLLDVQNSWGASWGTAGRFLANASWLASAWDCYAATVRAA